MVDDNSPQQKASEVATALVQIDEAHGLVFGEHLPKEVLGAPVEPLAFVSAADKARLADAFSASVGSATMAANVAPAFAEAQGIIKLAPESITALKAMTPMVAANGQNLGVLVNSSGKIGHVIQWMPATGASATTFLATLGPSVSMLAMQIQLAAIDKKVDRNIRLTQDVLDELRWSSDAELNALVATVRRGYREALSIGAVTDDVYGEVRGKEDLLDRSRTLLMLRLDAHSTELLQATSRDERRRWVREHNERVTSDLQALLNVQNAWYTFRALRTANLESKDSRLVGHLRETTQAEHERTMALVTRTADELQRQLGLLAEDSGRRTGRKSSRELKEAAEALRSVMLDALPQLGGETSQPEVLLGNSDDVARGSRVLSLLMKIQAPPALAAACRIGDEFRASFLFVLSSELVIAQARRLLADHHVEHVIPHSAVRFVRAADDGKQIELATTSGFFTITWADDKQQTLCFANQLIASLMRLPAGEVPPRPRATQQPANLMLLPGPAESSS